MNTSPIHAVILAAGKGSRMRSKLPKILHKVGGKTLVEHVVDTTLSLNADRIHVIVGHGKEQVIEQFSAHPHKDKLNFVEQKEQLGTGHAVQQALPEIPDHAAVLMLTADVPLIASSTLSSMLESMVSHTLTVLTAVVESPYGLGRITRDETDAVSGIVEEKDATESQRAINEINSGIMCARSAELKIWLGQVDDNNKQREYYLTDIVSLAYQSGNPITTIQPANNSEVEGINSRVQLAQVERTYQRNKANELMLSGVTIMDPERLDIRGDVNIGMDSVIDINVVISGNTTIGQGVTIYPNCVISDCQIGDGTVIFANTVLEQSSIGDNNQIGPFARIRPGSSLADDVKIGNFVETKKASIRHGAKVNHLSYVGDASVGQNTNIGAGVITCNYDGANKHQTVIGDNVFVGSDCQLVAPVEIGDGATIGAGSTITTNVNKDVLAISRGKQREIKGWQRPVKKENKR